LQPKWLYVNPRPRVSAGATTLAETEIFQQYLFQSSPTRERGRNAPIFRGEAIRLRFQSSPTRERGRNFHQCK